ncbi:MAG: hypothetical protein ISR73_14035 [Gammaproteobacteria bacterium]|nr:hypothetical protein [Gammaproteobacteria bacterium]
MQLEPGTGLPVWKKRLIYLFFFAALVALIVSQLPSVSYSTDLTRVGNGRPALVLAYDINSTGGMDVMKIMDTLRDDYIDRVEFLIADLGTPQGNQFAKRHNSINGTVMLYSAKGTYVRTIHLPPNTETLRYGLDEALAASN